MESWDDTRIDISVIIIVEYFMVVRRCTLVIGLFIIYTSD